MSKIKWFGSVVAVALLALAIGNPALGGKGGKGKPGGDAVAPGTIYFLTGDQQASMDQDGNGATNLPANVENGTPSVKLHNGSAWFVLIRPVAGTYPNGLPRKEVFVVREDGNETFTVRLTNDPLFEPMWKIQPPQWATDGTVGDGKVSFMGWSYDAIGQIVETGIYTQQVAFDIDDNPAGSLNGRTLAVSLDLDNDDEPNSEVHSWSPDGNSLAYDGNGIYVRDLVADTDVQIAGGGFPSWAPDGSLIAFTSVNNLMTITPSGGSETVLVAHGSSKSVIRGRHRPIWSPDAQHILYVLIEYNRRRGGLTDSLVRTTRTGSGSTTLVTEDFWLMTNAWRDFPLD